MRIILTSWVFVDRYFRVANGDIKIMSGRDECIGLVSLEERF